VRWGGGWHLTAAAAAQLAREAAVGELFLTHISGRYRPQEILTEAARHFPNVRVVADFDRISVSARNAGSRSSNRVPP
jgi:ribonuclease Z